MAPGHRHDEEEIATRLRMLPPAPAAWVEAAQELPFLGRRIDVILARAEADAAFRAALEADPEAALRDAGYEARPTTVAALRERLARG